MADLQDKVQFLSEELDPHPAGTESEYYTSTVIDKAFRANGLETIVQSFQAPLFGKLIYAFLAIIMFVAVLISGFHIVTAIIGLVLAVVSLLFWAFETFDKPFASENLKAVESQNIIARHDSIGPVRGRVPRPIVVIANYDSPKVDPLLNERVAGFYPMFTKVVNYIMIALPILMIFQVITPIPAGAKKFFWIVSIILSIPLVVFAAGRLIEHYVSPVSPGANVNGSGTAVLLALAERLNPESVVEMDEEALLEAYEQDDDYNLEDFLQGKRPKEREHIFAGKSVEAASTDMYEYELEAFEEEVEEQKDLDEIEVADEVETDDEIASEATEDAESLVRPKKINRKTIRRGVGVAKAAKIFPENTPIVYEFDARMPLTLEMYEKMHADKQTVETKKTPEEQALEALPKSDNKPQLEGSEEPQKELPKPEEKKTDEEASLDELKKEVSKTPSGRSRFADLPVDYKRPREEEVEEEETEAEDSEDLEEAEEVSEEQVDSKEPEVPEELDEAEKTEDDSQLRVVTDEETDEEPKKDQVQYHPITGRPIIDTSIPVDESVSNPTVRSRSEKDSSTPLVSRSEAKKQYERYKEQRKRNTEDEGVFDEDGTQEMTVDQIYRGDTSVESDTWGTSEFHPGEKASLLDLPDPAHSAVDPFSPEDIKPVGDFDFEDEEPISQSNDDEFVNFNTLEQQPPKEFDFPEDDGVFKKLGNKLSNVFSRSEKESSPKKKTASRRKKRKEDDDSFSEWLDLDEDFNAKKSGRKIGSWDNFDDNDRDDSWRGGAVSLDDDLDDDDLRENITQMQDYEFLSHEIWLVALGSNTLDHAGAKAFIENYHPELRRAFFINVYGVGDGDLNVITKEGAVIKRNGDRRLTSLIKRAGDIFHVRVGESQIDWSDTDLTPIHKRGFRSVSLMGLKNGMPAQAASVNDIVDNVDESQLRKVVDIIVETIRQV